MGNFVENVELGWVLNQLLEIGVEFLTEPIKFSLIEGKSVERWIDLFEKLCLLWCEVGIDWIVFQFKNFENKKKCLKCKGLFFNCVSQKFNIQSQSMYICI